MNNELSGMKAFVTVAELGSFSKAAEVLNLTQPALTRKIQKIESNLNTALFERTTRKIMLTQAGKMLLPKAKSLIASLDAAIFNISNLTSNVHDTVTLSCIPTAVFYFLPRAIVQFNQRYPHIKVRIYEQGIENCMASVRKGEVECGRFTPAAITVTARERKPPPPNVENPRHPNPAPPVRWPVVPDALRYLPR